MSAKEHHLCATHMVVGTYFLDTLLIEHYMIIGNLLPLNADHLYFDPWFWTWTSCLVLISVQPVVRAYLSQHLIEF